MNSEAKAIAASLMGDPSNDGIVYRAVRKAAQFGETCPSNIVLADLCNLASTGQPPNILARLAKRKAIKLERSNWERKVTILATGKSTAVSDTFKPLPEGAFAERGRRISESLRRRSATRRKQELAETVTQAIHAYAPVEQRKRDARKLSATALDFIPLDRPMPELRFAPPPAADPRPIAPSREPCPRCAIRGDLGCKHFAPFEPMEIA